MVTLKKVVVILISCLLMIGCWDREEINDVAFVVGTGLDLQNDQYLVSVQIPLVGAMGGQSGGGGGTSNDKTWLLDSTAAETIREATNKQQQSSSRSINYSHRRVVVIGEELARDGVSQVFDILARGNQNRLTAFVVIGKGMARDILNADAPLEQYPSEMIRELTLQATAKPLFLKTFMYQLSEPGLDAYAPVIKLVVTEPGEKGESSTNVSLDGLAVFKGDKLAGMLEAEQAQTVLMAINQASLPSFKVEAPNQSGKILIRLDEYETSIRALVNGQEITMNIDIRAKGALMENMSDLHLRNADNKKQLERVLQEHIKTDLEKSIQVLQTLGSDPIGFGEILRKNKNSKWVDVKNDWENMYPTITVNVQPRVSIENEGILSKTLQEE